MITRGRALFGNLVFGLLLGYSLSRIGFGDYRELNRMFTFQDLRMLLTFAGGVGLATLLTVLLRRKLRPAPTPPRVTRSVVVGAVLFGLGWAVSGGCPGIPIVQLGAGYLPSFITLTGIAAGMWAYRQLNARVLHQEPVNGCGG